MPPCQRARSCVRVVRAPTSHNNFLGASRMHELHHPWPPVCRVDEKSDVYGLGCLLYEAVARRAPFAHLAGDGEDKNLNMMYKVGGVASPDGGGHSDDDSVLRVGAGSAWLLWQQQLCRAVKVMMRMVTMQHLMRSDNPSTLALPATKNKIKQIIVAVAINNERPLLPEDTPPALAAVIERCWREDPRARPSAAELVRLFDILMQVGVTHGLQSGQVGQRQGKRALVAAGSIDPLICVDGNCTLVSNCFPPGCHHHFDAICDTTYAVTKSCHVT